MLEKVFDVTNENIYIGSVHYNDYDNFVLPVENAPLLPFFYKRLSYKHENELRAAIMQFPKTDKDKGLELNIEIPYEGLYIDIEINMLIQTIYVCPTAPTWFNELVSAVTRQFGYEFSIKKSSLCSEPLW